MLQKVKIRCHRTMMDINDPEEVSNVWQFVLHQIDSIAHQFVHGTPLAEGRKPNQNARTNYPSRISNKYKQLSSQNHSHTFFPLSSVAFATSMFIHRSTDLEIIFSILVKTRKNSLTQENRPADFDSGIWIFPMVYALLTIYAASG
jgi:hypothetical protein